MIDIKFIFKNIDGIEGEAKVVETDIDKAAKTGVFDGITKVNKEIVFLIQSVMPGAGSGVNGFTKTGRPIYRPSVPGAPPGVRSGRLKSSIFSRVKKVSEGVYEIDILWTANHGYYLNYGTKSMLPRPFANKKIFDDILQKIGPRAITVRINDGMRKKNIINPEDLITEKDISDLLIEARTER